MISQLLLYKIIQLFMFMLLGFVLVKSKILKSTDSRVLSKISLYLFMPSVIINSFDVTLTEEIATGLKIAFVSAFVIHVLLFIIDFIAKRFFKADSVERASIMYSNAANLIIPIVSFLLGDEWVIYCCAFVAVQIVFIWTHGICVFSSGQKINVKKIIFNVNLIAVLIGAVLMVSQIRLPHFVKEVVSPLSSMLGPIGMVIAGMVAADFNYGKALKNKRMYAVIFMRLILCPLFVLLIMKLLKTYVLPQCHNVLLISFLASITPSAATVMQLAQLYDSNEEYATAINIISTLLCVATMPVFVELFTRL